MGVDIPGRRRLHPGAGVATAGGQPTGGHRDCAGQHVRHPGDERRGTLCRHYFPGRAGRRGGRPPGIGGSEHGHGGVDCLPGVFGVVLYLIYGGGGAQHHGDRRPVLGGGVEVDNPHYPIGHYRGGVHGDRGHLVGALLPGHSSGAPGVGGDRLALSSPGGHTGATAHVGAVGDWAVMPDRPGVFDCSVQ